ncbi:TonB-dependent copper receptor [Alkanindiges illinoisensis]|uniref:TonB-dependent copper receptor n=1 Tax=Alkanindiges illinoisensis TaxID=197183 RepID=UPI000A0183A0|nr:TonB-dependent copper receptor [Alkanindiges illinoisensis]
MTLSVACIVYAGFHGNLAHADTSPAATDNVVTLPSDQVAASDELGSPTSSSAIPDCHHESVHSGHTGQNCELAPIVVTASNPQNTQAYLIQADPKQPIQPVPATDGADYLKHIAGFNAIRNGGTNGDAVFRGMFGSRLKILTNGSEMLGACPNRMDAPTSYIAPQNFDEITVVKGPQTVLFGAASAATVNFARTPERLEQDTITGQASATVASNQRFDNDIETILGNQQGSIRLNANTSRSDDYKDGNGKKVPAKWRKWNADLSATYTPTEDSWIELSAGKGDGEARYAGRSMDGSQFLRESVGVRFAQNNLLPWLQKLEGQVNYNNADHIMDNFTLRTPSPMDMGGEHDHDSGAMDGMDDSEDMSMGSMDSAMAMELARKTISGRLAATLNWLDYTLVSGLDASHSEHKGRMGGQYTYKDAVWDKDAEFEQTGIFAELSKPLSDNRKIITGLRIDQHEVKYLAHDAATNAYPTPYGKTRRETLPSGFVRLENRWPDQNLNGYVGVGHVARMPDYWELFSPVHSGSSSAFLGIKPEQTTQLDLGLTHHAGPWNSWISAYAGQINNFILISYHQHAGHAGNSAGAKNIDASIAGAEAGTSYQFTDNLTADLNVAYGWGRNETDNQPLPQIAPLDARIGLTYQQDRLSVGTLLRLVDRQDRVALNQGNIVGYDLGKSSGFGVFSVNAAYQFNPLLGLSIGVDNLFDKTYSEHLNRAGNSAFGYAATEIINEMGRNFWAKVTIKY